MPGEQQNAAGDASGEYEFDQALVLVHQSIQVS